MLSVINVIRNFKLLNVTFQPKYCWIERLAGGERAKETVVNFN
jgi:hypothetical protein